MAVRQGRSEVRDAKKNERHVADAGETVSRLCLTKTQAAADVATSC